MPAMWTGSARVLQFEFAGLAPALPSGCEHSLLQRRHGALVRSAHAYTISTVPEQERPFCAERIPAGAQRPSESPVGAPYDSPGQDAFPPAAQRRREPIAALGSPIQRSSRRPAKRVCILLRTSIHADPSDKSYDLLPASSWLRRRFSRGRQPSSAQGASFAPPLEAKLRPSRHSRAELGNEERKMRVQLHRCGSVDCYIQIGKHVSGRLQR